MVQQSPEEKLAAEAAAADEATRAAHAGADAYVLGPQDLLNIRVIDMEEIGDDPYPIDLRGYITLPRIGRVHAAGLTVERLQELLTSKFKEYLQETGGEYQRRRVS